jgi:hypothetical protein
MTWLTLGYGVLAAVLTYAENYIGSRERSAERKSRTCKTRRWSMISANWSVLFEIILLVDILLTVAEPIAIFPFVILGGWLGQFHAAEKERRKFRANAGNVANLRKRRKPRTLPATPDFGGSVAAPVAENAPDQTP